MVFNSTFNNILVLSWRSVLVVGETGEPGVNHRPVTINVTHINVYLHCVFVADFSRMVWFYIYLMKVIPEEEFEDTKGVIRVRKSKNRTQWPTAKRTKGQTTIYKTYT